MFLLQAKNTYNWQSASNLTLSGEPYQLILPLSLKGLFPDNDSVRLLSHELEDLDYSLLYQTYSAKGRNPAVDPKIMFKILIHAYSKNIYSSRKIETACRRDINFMWLLAGHKAPDRKWEEKMFQKIQDAVQLLNHEYIQDFSASAETRTQDLQKVSRFLEEKCQTDGTVYVHGRGRRESKNQGTCRKIPFDHLENILFSQLYPCLPLLQFYIMHLKSMMNIQNLSSWRIPTFSAVSMSCDK